ncbi:MAG TPA: substrate-binding domain-containing protein, partial [Alkalispirochaeta sp.]|nr:substrate-binding domain-containing protein [Alkalispirochaeta sp.]
SVVVGQDDYHLLRRRSGFEDYFHGSVPTERIEAASETELREQMNDRVCREPALDGIFVTNAAAHTVVEALISGTPPDRRACHASVVGYDLIPENIARLQDGSLTFVINQQPENQGYQAVYALYRHAVLNERVETQIRIPVDLVTRETLQFHELPAGSTQG